MSEARGIQVTGEDPDLAPETVALKAGLDEPAELGDLTDRQLAFWAWELIKQHSEHHFLATFDGQHYVYENGVWVEDGEQRVGELGVGMLGPEWGRNVKRELLERVQSERGYRRDELGAPEGAVTVKNGLLHLEDRELEDHAPDHRAINKLPVEFDPDAGIEGTRFEEFLIESVDPQDLDKLQEYAGYTLLKDAQPYKKALFLVGPTDSGKGTFLKTLEMILGDDNVASETLENLVDSRWGMHSIYGQMANISNEVSREGVENVGQFKMLTGGEDKVTAEDKGVSKYQFTVTQKFLFATNEFPQVENADGAFYNRLLFAKFPHTVPDEEKENLLGQFREERSAILNWMLDGLDRLRENGGMFSGERSIDDKKEITKAFGSTVEQFAHAALDVTGDTDHVVHKKELYSAFTRYCDFINEETPGQTKFTRELKQEAGISDGKSRRVDPDGNRKDVYKGAKLNEDLFKKIQAELPAHSYECEDGGDGGQQSLT